MITLIDDIYTYSLLCDRLRHALDIKEAAQWIIGDILNETQTVYAERTIAGLAADIGVSSSSLYTYREMAALYPEHVRTVYREKELYFSHLRLAMSLGSLDEARRFLDLCALNHWSVNLATLELRRLKGTYVPPMPQYVTCTFHREGTRVYISGLEGIEMGVEYDLAIRGRR